MPKLTKAVARKVLAIVDAGLVRGVGSPVPGEMCVEAAVCFALGEPHGDEPSCVSPAIRAFKIGLNDSAWSTPKARAAGMRRLAIAQLGTADLFDHIKFARRVAMLSVAIVIPRTLRFIASMKMLEQHRETLLQAALDCEVATDLPAATRYATDAANAARYAAGYADAIADATGDAIANAARYAADAADAARYAAANAANAARYADAIRYTTDAVDAARYAADAANAARYTAANAANAARYTTDAVDQELSTFAEAVVQLLIEMNTVGSRWLNLTE